MEYQKCPICEGNGSVSGGFYSHAGDCPYWTSDHTMEICQACNGTGLILEPEEPSYVEK